MSSEGTGAPISQQDAMDLLHKLMTESTKVVANFRCSDGRVKASVVGLIRSAPDGALWVVDPEVPLGSMLSFDPSLFTVRKYGDGRSMLDGGETPFGTRIRSLLTFVFAEGSTLGIFDFSDPDSDD
jgi:hypothetical protein